MEPLHVAMAIAVVVATVAAYAPALRAPFQFDDVPGIVDNRSIRTLWPPSVALSPPAATSVSGRPVVNYSLAVNYAVNEALGVDQRADPDGPNKTVGYHIVNIALHLLCGVLLFGILRRTIRAQRFAEDLAHRADAVAGIIAALWLIHPLQSEAVDYIIQRTELFVSACYLGTLYASIRAWDAETKQARARWVVASVLTCLLGMGSKEVMITAPLLVVLYDRAFRFSSWSELLRSDSSRRWLYLLLFATSAWSVSLIAAGTRSTAGFNLGITWYEYFYTQLWAITHYVRLAFWPGALTIDYGQDAVTGLRGVPGAALLAAFGIATLVAFLGAWFFLILAPSSSVVPIRTEIAAERRFYLPLIAVITLAVFGVDALRRHVAQRYPNVRRLLINPGPELFLTLVGLALFVTTFRRSAEYTDLEALWRDAVAVVPGNARAYDHLAAALTEQRPPRYEEADSLFRRAIALDSTYMPAWTNLAAIDVKRGRLADAQALLERVLKINPSYVHAEEMLGETLSRAGKPTSAIERLEHVVASFPDDESLVALGVAYAEAGRAGDALSTFQRALSINPSRADAAGYVGSILLDQGHLPEAIGYLETAARRGPPVALTFGLLSLAYAESGRATDAIVAARTVSTMPATDASAEILAGRAMLIVQRAPEAEQLFGTAVRLNPNDPEALTRLGIAKAVLNKPSEAVGLFRRAIAINPEYQPALEALRRSGGAK
jgi:tetratricopeptide (TPR) repeat protein